jgi:hypothetical protein
LWGQARQRTRSIIRGAAITTAGTTGETTTTTVATTTVVTTIGMTGTITTAITTGTTGDGTIGTMIAIVIAIITTGATGKPYNREDDYRYRTRLFARHCPLCRALAIVERFNHAERIVLLK